MGFLADQEQQYWPFRSTDFLVSLAVLKLKLSFTYLAGSHTVMRIVLERSCRYKPAHRLIAKVFVFFQLRMQNLQPHKWKRTNQKNSNGICDLMSCSGSEADEMWSVGCVEIFRGYLNMSSILFYIINSQDKKDIRERNYAVTKNCHCQNI